MEYFNFFKDVGSSLKGTGSSSSSGLTESVGKAFDDMCPGTSFQMGNDRTSDGINKDKNGKYKICQRKNLFGPNDPPFYVVNGKEEKFPKAAPNTPPKAEPNTPPKAEPNTPPRANTQKPKPKAAPNTPPKAASKTGKRRKSVRRKNVRRKSVRRKKC
jgi:hypothetical protein